MIPSSNPVKCTRCNSIKPRQRFYRRAEGAGCIRQPCIACRAARKKCVRCGNIFLTSTGGSARKSRCPSCYPIYRRAACLVQGSRSRCRRLGTPHTITIEWVEERLHQSCPRTGDVLVLDRPAKDLRDRHPRTPSLDQIIPQAGYTPTNTQVVVWWHNACKQTFTDDEVLELCRRVIRKASLSDMSPVQIAVVETI